MSDMYFENLPSTSTPITAENLNKLNDDVYSLVEKKIGTWIDGKTLYRKVITGTTTNTTNGTWGYTEIDLNIANRKDFWIKTAFYYDSYGDSLVIPYTTNSGYIIKAMLLNNNRLRIITNSSDFNSLEFIVIIEYTKTTG